MKSIRNIALSALLTVGTFSTVFYTSCTKDECKDVVCKNDGTCVSGTCNCTVGYTGSDCGSEIRTTYYNTYKGDGSDSDGDTYTNFGLKFYAVGTQAKTFGMDVLDANNVSIGAFTVTLQTNGTFVVNQKVDGTTTFTGTGTISATSSSLSLTVDDTIDGKYIITFANMLKQ